MNCYSELDAQGLWPSIPADQPANSWLSRLLDRPKLGTSWLFGLHDGNWHQLSAVHPSISS